jgi:hypothetical protein
MEQEVELRKYMQKGWTDFAKDPAAGPGRATYGSKKGVRPVGLERLGEPKSPATAHIREYGADFRCPIWTDWLLLPVH